MMQDECGMTHLAMIVFFPKVHKVIEKVGFELFESFRIQGALSLDVDWVRFTLGLKREQKGEAGYKPVSYTHLTLPTTYSV